MVGVVGMLAALAVMGAAQETSTQAPRPDPAPNVAPTEADGLMEQANRLVETDPKAALATMKRAAATGNPEAINGLGVFIYTGVGAPADPVKGRKLYEDALARGSQGAALNLGRLLLTDDIQANDDVGIGLLTPLAKNDTFAPRVLYPLGRAMLLGMGSHPQDVEGGLGMLAMAEAYEADNADLLYLLGRAHQNGWGGWKEDSVKAADYFRRSAERDDARAQWQYGMMLLNGDGAPLNPSDAWVWVKKSADNGYLNGQVSAAVMLAIGQGVRENDPEAREWYRKAAEQGSAHALRSLGYMLLTGEGGAVEPSRGQAYVELAIEGGDEAAGTLLRDMGKTLSAADRRSADAVKSDWKRKFGDPS